MKKTDIKELEREQLASWLQDQGIAPYRAGQILRWVYFRQADSFEVMTDLRKEIRTLLLTHFTINRLVKAKIQTSKDGSIKYLFKLDKGNYIETVLLPEKNHYTLCISSQGGCAQGCRFCLTAKGGFVRNLTRGEIVAQVRDVQNDLDNLMPLTNIVFMGMGEPLANYENVISALHTICDTDCGLQFSNRRVTLSTAGLVPRFADLGRDAKVNLAVSLNAADNKTRNMLMPINRKYPIENLLEACSRYPLPPRRKITFEYILIKGVNDSVEDAKRLVRLLKPIRCKINLIPFNEHEGSEFKRSEESTIHGFQDILIKNNYTTMIRSSKGKDILAACGQLGAQVRRRETD